MSLETLWFCVVAFFWAGYLMLEGFDFGVGILLPFVGRGEHDRGEMLETIAPVWDGNEVWLVVAGGATFAAFPAWYATMFSGFYVALLVVLVLLIVRVLSFEWRERDESSRWRGLWIWANVVASFGAPLIWGVALANLVQGVPIDSNGDYAGGLADLFSPYTVTAGLVVVVLFAMHGATFLTLRTTGPLQRRAMNAARRLSWPAVALATILLAWTVVVATDANQKSALPAALVAGAAILAFAAGAVLTARERGVPAFVASATGIVLAVATIFTSLYPRVMVSSSDFSNSLTTANAASAHYTLAVISVVAVVVTPVVLAYQAWTYHVLRGRLAGASRVLAAGAPESLRRLKTGPLDRRLLRRARSVRLLLAADVAIGGAAAALVVAQATLLARVIAGSFAGDAVDDLARPLELLLLAFAGRAVLAWAFEVVGRLAATSVLSQLRLALAERRIADEPAALDGAQTGDLAASAVFGATALGGVLRPVSAAARPGGASCRSR